MYVEFCIRKSADRREAGEGGMSERVNEREGRREREKFGGREARGRRREEVQRGSERPRKALEVGRR